MEVRITVQRPWMTLMTIIALFLWSTGIVTVGLGGSEPGIGGRLNGAVAAEAAQSVDRERIRREVLAQREEILRFELEQLEDEAMRSGSLPEKIREVTEHRMILLAIISERDQSEKMLRSSLEQLWDAQGTDFSTSATGHIRLAWPVNPDLGISAHFEDEGYEARFKMAHHAIDIPTEQGTLIAAPADGQVTHVSMNGLGYSYITIAHVDGFETVYGHISAALVEPGDRVRTGEAIARSGGRPGSPGAGLLTTGPHLHFAVKKDGALVDPLKYLVHYGE